MENVYNLTKDFDIQYHENHTGGSMPSLHTHNTYEIYYLHEGSRNYIINNKVYGVDKGSVALIPPNVFHKTTGEKYTRTLINFSLNYLLDFFSEDAAKKLLSCFSTAVFKLPAEKQEIICSILSRIYDNSQKTVYDERPLLLGNILNILNQCKKAEKYEPKNASDTLLSEILDYIGKNYTSIENLNEIAKRFYITKYHLCRIFKAATGMSVFEYINILKIQQACTMLSQSRMLIGEICSECGFKSQAYFNKTFLSRIGMNPGEYRKQFSK